MARTPLMAGNWKMNLDHLEANHLVQGLAMELCPTHDHDYSKCEVLVIPPFTDIRTVQTIVDADDLGIKYGAQDVSIHDNGAYTGEISTEMLTKLGVSYVVMGHSERREYHGESDELVGAKARKVFDAGMTPILCCGEALEVRKAGTHVEFVLGQIRAALDGWKRRRGRQDRHRLRAHLGHRHRRDRYRRGRPGSVRRDPRGPAPRTTAPQTAESTRILYGGSAKPGQHQGAHGSARRRRRASSAARPSRRTPSPPWRRSTPEKPSRTRFAWPRQPGRSGREVGPTGVPVGPTGILS